MATVFYTRPFEERLRAANYMRERYQSDPDYRERRRRSNREAQARYRERQRERNA